MKKILFFCFITFLSVGQNTPTEVVTGLPEKVRCFDFYNNDIYFTTLEDGFSMLGKVNFVIPNSNYEVINATLSFPLGLKIHNNTLYFSEFLPPKISKIVLTQNPLVTEVLPIIFTDFFPSSGLRVYDNELYFSENPINIKKVPLSNLSQTPTIIIENTPNPFDFIKENNLLYFIENDGQDGRISRKNLNDPITVQPQQIALVNDPVSLVKFNNFLFVGTNDYKIYKIDLNQANPLAELFYEPADGVSFIGVLNLYNNELYFSYNEADFINQTFEGKIMKFSQSQLSTTTFPTINDFKFSPNPAQSTLNIQTEETINDICVYDMLGKKVITNQVSNTSIDVSSLAKGMYIVKVVGENNKIFSSKFIKE